MMTINMKDPVILRMKIILHTMVKELLIYEDLALHRTILMTILKENPVGTTDAEEEKVNTREQKEKRLYVLMSSKAG